jgi:hypothetical protein
LATGLPLRQQLRQCAHVGVLERMPMFSEILEDGVRWEDGTELRADVILWCMDFRSSLDHLAPLMLRVAGRHHDGGSPSDTGGQGAAGASGGLRFLRINNWR